MSRVAVFVDAGYFWVQSVYVVHGRKDARARIVLDHRALRERLLEQVATQFQRKDLLRIYWYDGPGNHGKTAHHTEIEQLDDFKLRMGTRNGAGDQKAVDGLIIADMIGLAQTRAISDALVISGDADLVPGVIAAQGLGIRVHLLSMGPSNATSPYLKAEVDQKSHWDDVTVKAFASPASPKAPIKVAATQAPSSALTSNGAAGMVADKAQSAAIEGNGSEITLATVAKTAYGELKPGQVANLPAEGNIPAALDSHLLRVARRLTQRTLSDTEKRQLRTEFRKCRTSEEKEASLGQHAADADSAKKPA
jgi:uncharacterized LabA/DUF88 family protein